MFTTTRRISSVLFLALSVFSMGSALRADGGVTVSPVAEQDHDMYKALLDKIDNGIDTLQLDNGMRVICVPQKYTNSVTTAMVYNVGSKHEESTEFGMAHIVEHMIFKGTKNRGEKDLVRLTRHLGCDKGGFNAHTSNDYTYYYFNTDAGNWKSFVDVIADSAQNMDWDSEVLDSEIQAIFQEIKMRGDDQIGGIWDTFRSWLPPHHPYSHLIIGYKDQIFDFTREDVLAFYKKYYTPDNAVLLVVGNVESAEVFKHASKAFENFRGESTVKKAKPRPFYSNFAHSIQKVYHTQQYHMKGFFWSGPKDSDAESAALDYLIFALSKRLKHKWVDTEGWCIQVGVMAHALKEESLILSYLVPKDEHLDKDFKALLNAEIQSIIAEGITNEEFAQAHKSFTGNLISLAESVHGLSLGLAKSFFPQTSTQGWYDQLEALNEVTPELVKHVAHSYLRPFRMHELHKEPLPAEELAGWQALQEETDAHEHALLSARRRTNTTKNDGIEFMLPARGELAWPKDITPDRSEVLSNGMTLHYVHNDVSPMVSCGISLKDAEAVGQAWAMLQKQHTGSFWSSLMIHGTKTMSKKEFDDAFDSLGAAAVSTPYGLGVSGMKGDIAEALALSAHAIAEPFFTKETPAEVADGELYPSQILERKKMEIVQLVQMNQNNPDYKFGRFLSERVMSVYPWSYTEEEDLKHALAGSLVDVKAYHQLMTDPARVECIVCGDISFDDARSLVENHLVPVMTGTAPAYTVPAVPALEKHTGTEHIEMPLSEVTVRGICPTVLRSHPDYAVLVLLDTYMKDRVFDIRQETGLFYGGWSFLAPATDRIPALFGVGTQTGPGRVEETVDRLKQMLREQADSGLTEETLDRLRQEWLLANSKYTHTNTTIASRIARGVVSGQPWNAATVMRNRIQSLTLEQVNDAMNRHCNPDNWVFVTLGREAAVA